MVAPKTVLLRPPPHPARVSSPSSTSPGHPPLSRLTGWARGCVRDGHWIPRALLLAALGYVLLRYLGDAGYRPFFAPVNLVAHEAGHALFSWSGSRWLTVAGGTLFELAVPVAFGAAFVRQRDPFAVGVALFWLGTALVDVSVYAGDARSRLLPLVSLWPGPPIHDWAWLLERAGHPEWDRPLSRLFRHAGIVAMAGALVWGGVVVRQVREHARSGGTRSGPAGRTKPRPGPGGPGRG